MISDIDIGLLLLLYFIQNVCWIVGGVCCISWVCKVIKDACYLVSYFFFSFKSTIIREFYPVLYLFILSYWLILSKHYLWIIYILLSPDLRIKHSTCPKGINELAYYARRTGLPQWLRSKESACNAGDTASIPGSGKSPEGGNGNLLQHSSLENPMDRGP